MDRPCSAHRACVPRCAGPDEQKARRGHQDFGEASRGAHPLAGKNVSHRDLYVNGPTRDPGARRCGPGMLRTPGADLGRRHRIRGGRQVMPGGSGTVTRCRPGLRLAGQLQTPSQSRNLRVSKSAPARGLSPVCAAVFPGPAAVRPVRRPGERLVPAGREAQSMSRYDTITNARMSAGHRREHWARVKQAGRRARRIARNGPRPARRHGQCDGRAAALLGVHRPVRRDARPEECVTTNEGA